MPHTAAFNALASKLVAIFNERSAEAHGKAVPARILADAFRSQGANLDDPQLAINAAKTGDRNLLMALKGAGTNFAMPDSEGYTPLHLAAQIGNKDAVSFLVGAGVPLHSKTRAEGLTPAHLAAYAGKAEALIAIIDYNRSLLEQEDIKGNTVAHWAAWGGHVNVLKFVLRKNAEGQKENASLGKQKHPDLFSLKNKAGQTPLDVALSSPPSTSEAIDFLKPLSPSANSELTP